MSNTSAKGKATIYKSAVVDRTPEGETSSDNTSVVVGETY